MTEQQWAWEPEDDQENAILAAANHLLRFGHPPVDRHICRRVPATGAPVDAIRWLVDRFGEDDPLLPYSPAGRALIQSIRDWLNITMQGREWEALCEYMAANAPEPEPYDGYPDDYPEPSEDWDDEGDWD